LTQIKSALAPRPNLMVWSAAVRGDTGRIPKEYPNEQARGGIMADREITNHN